MNYAVVDPSGGVVSNVVVGDSLEVVASIVGPCVEETEATGPAGIGYTWDGSVFTPPVIRPPMPTEGGPWVWNEEIQDWVEQN